MPRNYRTNSLFFTAFIGCFPLLASTPLLVNGTADEPTYIAALTPCTDGILFAQGTAYTPHAYFDSLFPLGGTLALNGGHFTLGTDIKCASNMNFYSGGYCDGQFNTLFLPHNDEPFFFPTKSLWLPPPLDDDDHTPSNEEDIFTLPNLYTTTITAWHHTDNASYIAVVTAENKKLLTVYTMNGEEVAAVARYSFLLPIDRIDWAPESPTCIVSTQDESFFVSLHGETLLIATPLFRGTGTIRSISWNANGSRCVIAVHTSRPFVTLYERHGANLVKEAHFNLYSGQKLYAAALSDSGEHCALILKTRGRANRIARYHIPFTLAPSFSLVANGVLRKEANAVVFVPGSESAVIIAPKKSTGDNKLIYCDAQGIEKTPFFELLSSNEEYVDIRWHPQRKNVLGVLSITPDGAHKLRNHPFFLPELSEVTIDLPATIHSGFIAWLPPDSATPPATDAHANHRMTLANINVVSNGPVIIQDPLFFHGKTMWDGMQHSLTVAPRVPLHLAPNSSLTLRNMDLHHAGSPLTISGERNTRLNIFNTTLPTNGFCSHVPVSLFGNSSLSSYVNGTFVLEPQSNVSSRHDMTLKGTLAVNGIFKLKHKATCTINGHLATTSNGSVHGPGIIELNGCLSISNGSTLLLDTLHLVVKNDCTLENGVIAMRNCRISFGEESYVINSGTYNSSKHASLMTAVRAMR